MEQSKKTSPEPENAASIDQEEINTSGWDAITAEFERIYPGQENPNHYGNLISWRLGGPNPLDGISIYDGGDYWHFVSYGLSELYERLGSDVTDYGRESIV